MNIETNLFVLSVNNKWGQGNRDIKSRKVVPGGEIWQIAVTIKIVSDSMKTAIWHIS